MKKTIILLIGLLLTLVLGEIAPRFMINKNLEKFVGDQHAFAERAWIEARVFLSGSAEPFFWTAIRVEEVVKKEEPKGQSCYEATIRAYTFFGLPWSSVFVSSCGDGVIQRQYWGLFPLITGWSPISNAVRFLKQFMVGFGDYTSCEF
jgi:hypothetical protein